MKEVLVGADTITLRDSIPIPQSGSGSNGLPAPPSSVNGSRSNSGYLLRSRSLVDLLRKFSVSDSAWSPRRWRSRMRSLDGDAARSMITLWPRKGL